MDPKNTSTSHGHGMGEWWSQLSLNPGDPFSDNPCWRFRNPTQKKPTRGWYETTVNHGRKVPGPQQVRWLCRSSGCHQLVVETMKKVAPKCSTPKIVGEVVATQLFFFMYTPKIGGKMNPFWLYNIFQRGWNSTTNQLLCLIDSSFGQITSTRNTPSSFKVCMTRIVSIIPEVKTPGKTVSQTLG